MSGGRVSVVCLGMLAAMLGAVGDVSAQSFRHEGPHPEWYWVPSQPDESRVGGCFGHCGQGCSGTLSVCGTYRHEWVRRLDGPVHENGPLTGTECRFEGMVPADWPGGYLEGVEYSFTIYRYTAAGQWIFLGQTHRACEDHDAACRSAGHCFSPPMLLPPIHHLIALLRSTTCFSRNKDWSYPETFTHWKTTEIHLLGNSCQVYVGSTSG